MTLTPQERAELRELHMWRGRFLTYATDEEELNVAYVCEGCEQQMDEELTCPTIRLLDALEAAEAELEWLRKAPKPGTIFECARCGRKVCGMEKEATPTISDPTLHLAAGPALDDPYQPGGES